MVSAPDSWMGAVIMLAARRGRRWPRRARATAGRGMVVAHVRQEQVARSRDQFGGAFAALRCDQGVVAAVDHEHRHVERGEPGAAVARCVDRGELAGGTLGVEAAVVLCGRDAPAASSGSKYFFDAQIREFSDASM